MSVHINAQKGDIADTILLPGIRSVPSISLKHF